MPKEKPMTDEQYAQWSRLRARGQLWHLLVRGVLFWGGGCAALWSIAMGVWSSLSDWTDLVPTILSHLRIAVIIFPIGGLLFGQWTWAIGERKYAATKHKRCTSCGYDLTGVESPKCPECGAERNTTRE